VGKQLKVELLDQKDIARLPPKRQIKSATAMKANALRPIRKNFMIPATEQRF